ncbi:MAG: hypothetical protein OEZ01_17565, partial [Candidatus Heimdallarchaeota archaeon]|nr:hypothetical protein [Candidatus Heimdallarchaeota archaeon]
MKKNEIESLIRHIENCTDTQIEHELEAVQIIIENLFESKKYSAISNLYLGLPGYHKELCSFEAAFSLAHQKKDFEAIEAYENLLKFQPRNTTVLFNLHLLKIDQDDIHGAFNLISKAHDLEPEDNKIKKQFIKLKEYTDELQQIDERFRNASLLISSENEYVVNRLNNFITNFKKDPEQYNFKLVIPRWKFQALIGADREKAYSLSEQWIEKFYIRKTGNRNQHRALEFELNPYLENSIKNASLRKIETKWIKGFENLNTEYLDH